MLLAIDTSTRKSILALDDNGRRIVRQFEPRMTQRMIFAELASLLCEDLLDRLTGVVVGIGPGSFTGVKIGVMAAKTLAWSRGIPIVGVGSLDSVAAGTPSPSEPNSLLLVAVPSTRGEVYIRMYEFSDMQWLPSGEIRDISLSFPDNLEWLPDKPFLLSGEAAQQTSMVMGNIRKVDVVPEELRFPSADGLLSLARLKFDSGQTDNPMHLNPDYIRLSQPDRLSGRGTR